MNNKNYIQFLKEEYEKACESCLLAGERLSDIHKYSMKEINLIIKTYNRKLKEEYEIKNNDYRMQGIIAECQAIITVHLMSGSKKKLNMQKLLPDLYTTNNNKKTLEQMKQEYIKKYSKYSRKNK